MSDVAAGLSDEELAELCALADGTLPPERRPAVEARVAASPELQELVDRQRRAVMATRALDSEPVPESLRAAVDARRRGLARRSIPRSRLVPRLAAAGALVAAIAVILVVVLGGGPGGPTVAEAAQFAARAPTGQAPPPLGTSGTTLALDVEGVAFPDLARSYGWHAIGVRRDRLDNRDAVVVFYEKGARRIGYVIVAGAGLARPETGGRTERDGVLFQTLRVGGRNVVTWRRLGHTCVLAGTAPPAELLALASWQAGGTLLY
jgi:hypothetical protein